MRATEIVYTTGDATAPKGDGPKIIPHVCNDIGGWGSGFVLALSARWAAPEAAYRALGPAPVDALVAYCQWSPSGNPVMLMPAWAL